MLTLSVDDAAFNVYKNISFCTAREAVGIDHDQYMIVLERIGTSIKVCVAKSDK